MALAIGLSLSVTFYERQEVVYIMCNIYLKQDSNNASSTLLMNQHQFHARAGKNDVLCHTVLGKRKMVAKPNLKAITWSDLKACMETQPVNN